MFAPTFPPHRPDAAVDAPTEWLVPRPSYEPAPRMVLPARSTLGTLFDVAARVGTAVTLAALLIVTGTLLTMFDVEPMPRGVATAGR